MKTIEISDSAHELLTEINEREDRTLSEAASAILIVAIGKIWSNQWCIEGPIPDDQD